MTTDVVVVGGGIVGLATAWHLVRGGARTVLLDAALPGRASDAGAGILSFGRTRGGDDPRQPLFAAAARDYPAMIDALATAGAGPTGYAVCGRLMVWTDDDEEEPFRRVAADVIGRAEGCDVLDGERARSMFPPLGPARGVIHDPRGARVDGRLLGAALRRAATEAGLVVRWVRAGRLLRQGARIAGVGAAGEEIRAGHVVLAAGAWCRALGRSVGVDVPVAPMRGQIIHLDVAADTTGWPIVSGFRDHYMLAWDDRRVVVGATREAGSGFAVGTTASGIMEVLGEALRIAPGLARASLREVRVGLRPASTDGLPILGPVPGLDGLHLATGHGPVGLQLGPWSGRAVAASILGDAVSTDLGPFSLARFG